MKIPLPTDSDSKGMMMSGSSTGRKELIHELRETSLIGGNAIQRRGMVDKGVQFIGNMDLGSGDTSEYVFGSRNSYDSFNEGFQFNSHVHSPIEAPTIRFSVTASSLTTPHPPQSPSTPPIGKLNSSSSSESVDVTSFNHDKSDSDHFFKGKEANRSAESKDYTSVVVEEGKQPNFRANESNPTVPSSKEPSKTSTLRLSDRPRSAESEDDIEKMDDPEQDGAIFDQKALYKTKTLAEDSQNSEKMDKNGNRSDGEPSEVDNDCIVQCLYYTIQCCECVTF